MVSKTSLQPSTEIRVVSISDTDLLELAKNIRKNAHAPYSNYWVGAAILDDQLNVHTACNVENAAFPLSACAEANAIGSMVAAGSRHIRVIVIVGGYTEAGHCPPCGGCRQRIKEFADENTRILLLTKQGELATYKIEQLLPESFEF